LETALLSLAAAGKEQEMLPVGQKYGQRWETSCRDWSNVVSGVADPPAEETRCSGALVVGVKTITPSRFQVAP
jgi:hypothetical protein